MGGVFPKNTCKMLDCMCKEMKDDSGKPEQPQSRFGGLCMYENAIQKKNDVLALLLLGEGAIISPLLLDCYWILH